MSDLEPPLSRAASAALDFIWLSVAAGERSTIAASLANDSWWTDEAEVRIPFSTLAEIIAHAEAFYVDRLRSYIADVVSSSPDPVRDTVLAQINREVEANWVERAKLTQRWLQIDLRAQAWWSPWLGFVEARNAWAHGLGELTRRQSADGKVLSNLAAAGLTVRAQRVIVTFESVREAARSAETVIREVDRSSTPPGQVREGLEV